MKKAILTIAFLLASSVARGQATPAWISWSNAWVRWDGGNPTPAGVQTVDCTSNALLLISCPDPPEPSGVLNLVLGSQSPGTAWGVPPGAVAAVPSATPVAQMLTNCTQTSAGSAVTGTTNETALWACQIPAGALGTAGRIRLEVYSTLIYNNLNTDTLRVQLKYGCADGTTVACSAGQVMYDATGPSHALQGSTQIAVLYSIDLLGAGTTSTETCVWQSQWGPNGTPAKGVGSLGSATAESRAPMFCSANTNGTWAPNTVDSSVASYFMITVKWSTGTTNTSIQTMGSRVVVF